MPTADQITTINAGSVAAANKANATAGVVPQSATTSGTFVTPPPPPSNPPDQPAKPVTSFSSDTANQYSSDNAQKLQTLKNTGLTLGQDGLARYSDSSFATAPTDATQGEDGTWQSGGVKYAIGPSTTQDPELQKINDQITGMKTQFDSTSRAMIDNIKSQFDSIIKQQGDINTRQTASVDQSLLMGGSSRYAQISSTGEHSAIMSSGLDKIADLTQKEQGAVLQAQQAMDAGDEKLLDQALGLAQKARDEKQSAAADLSKKLTDQADKLKVQKQQASIDAAIGSQLSSGVSDPSSIIAALAKQGISVSAKDVNDSIANLTPDAKNVFDIQKTAAGAGAPPAVLSAIGSSKSVTDAFKAAGDFMQNATGDLGAYNQYKRDSAAQGLTPSSFQTWQSTNEYNKAYATAKGTAAGKATGEGNANPTDYSSLSPTVQNTLKTNGFTGYNSDTQNLASQLVGGQIAPGELSKRTTGNSSYNDVLVAADKYSLATTGQHFNIAKADTQYKFANNKATQDTLNYLGSLVGTDNGSGTLAGGNLDQLISLSDKRITPNDPLSSVHGGQNQQGFPALNDVRQWTKLQSGNPDIAAYYSTLLEVSDQVAKVLQGGGSSGTSDAKLKQAQDLFQKGFTPDQVKAVAGSLKGLLANRATSMVKDNPYLSDYANQLGITKGADGHISTNSQLLQQESDAEGKMTTFYHSSPENQALIDDIHKQFPDMSAYEISQKLKI